MTRFLALVLLGLWLSAPPVAAADTPSVVDLSYRLFSADRSEREAALARLLDRGETDVVAAMIHALRFLERDSRPVVGALRALTGADPGVSWHDWMLWQEGHPEIRPFDGYDAVLADVMASIDPKFRLFLRPGIAHEIRLEEIVWGGVPKDGIPALNYPVHVPAADADYLTDDELVFGVAIAGDARAYPLRILDWHEMANDWVGGVHVSLAYCTLCGSGILYSSHVAPHRAPFQFGSSGLLYRSNKLMYDQQTHSLWNQYTGRPVVGPLVGPLGGPGIKLEVLPMVIGRWRDWKTRHPETKVLSIRTGYRRNYLPGAAYGEYFLSDRLMFPARVADRRLAAKDYVFVLRLGGAEKAWPVARFAGGKVIADRVGVLDVVLVGDRAGRTVRAYRADDRTFTAVPDDPGRLRSAGEFWRIEEAALVGPRGGRLDRLPGHVAYWFAYSGFAAGKAALGE